MKDSLLNCDDDDAGSYATTGLVTDATTLESLKEIMKSMPPLPQRASPFDVKPLPYKMDDFDRFSWLTGLPITITDHPLTRDEWTPPEDPFIEYEPKDYPWLKALGFGKTTTVRTAYAINRRYLTPFC